MNLHKLFFLTLSTAVFSLATSTFERSYGGIAGYEVVCTSDYGFAVVGFYALNRDIICLVKTDSLGDTLWTSFISQPYVNKGSYSLKELSDGGFVAVGYRDSIDGPINDTIPADAYLVRFNSFGDTLWSKVYDGESLDKGYRIEIARDSNFVIVGETKSYGQSSSDILFMKTDTAGNVLRLRTYGGDSYETARCVKNTADNGFIIAGSTSSGIYLIKTDSLGNIGIKEMEISGVACLIAQLTILPSLATERLNIKYVVNHTGATNVSVYDATGARVQLIKQENLLPGCYYEKIAVRNLSSGAYFVVLEQNNQKISKKFLLIK